MQAEDQTKTLRAPDFFIVGAPKCGTTAMDSYLSQHPEIYMPAAKELHYFGSDLEWRKRICPREAYFSYFEGVPRELTAGESSVYYLYSARAAEEIHMYNTNALVIAMLRDPLEMIPSLHRQLLRTGDEFIFDLGEALDAEAERKLGLQLPPAENPGMNQALYYSEFARFGEQLERYISIFGRERVHVALYDDFKKSPADVYRGVLRFLEVDADFQPEFPRVNSNKEIRRPGLWRLAKFPHPILRTLWRAALPPSVRGAILSRAADHYLEDGEREPPSAATVERLRAAYASDVERLQGLLDRDLGHWLGGIR